MTPEIFQSPWTLLMVLQLDTNDNHVREHNTSIFTPLLHAHTMTKNDPVAKHCNAADNRTKEQLYPPRYLFGLCDSRSAWQPYPNGT